MRWFMKGSTWNSRASARLIFNAGTLWPIVNSAIFLRVKVARQSRKPAAIGAFILSLSRGDARW